MGPGFFVLHFYCCGDGLCEWRSMYLLTKAQNSSEGGLRSRFDFFPFLARPTYKLKAPSVNTRQLRNDYLTGKHENWIGAMKIAGDHDSVIFEAKM